MVANQKERTMDNEAIFRIVFAGLLLALIVERMYYGLKARRESKRGPRRERLAESARNEGFWAVLLRFIMFFVLIAALTLYLVYPSWIALLSFPLPLWLRWAGAGLSLASILYIAWVQHFLGKQWSASLEIAKDHELVTSGPYRLIRHPLYMGIIFMAPGFALVTASWILVALLPIGVFLFLRVRKEERMMIERFGEEYLNYMRKTKRFIPFVY